MFNLACEYAQGLNLHNLDSQYFPPHFNKENVDNDRKGFWELIHLEFFYRLIYNRPATMSKSTLSWKVNLPWLGTDSAPDTPQVPTVKFILTSRITFILADFFQALEGAELRHDPDVAAKVEALCRDIDGLYTDWRIVSSR